LAYVFTDSSKEWEDQILEFSRLIIDRLNRKNIKKVAKVLGCYDPSLGSIRLLEKCLQNLKIEQQVVDEIVDPLFLLWSIRSNGIAHFGDSVPEIDIRKNFKTFVTSIDNSMETLAELIEQHFFDISKEGHLIR
jgi:hypothetical protein